MLDSGVGDYVLVVVGVDEVGVVGEPADPEEGHDSHEHLDQLKREREGIAGTLRVREWELWRVSNHNNARAHSKIQMRDETREIYCWKLIKFISHHSLALWLL